MHHDCGKATLLNDYFACVFTMDNGIIDTSRLPTKINAKMSPTCTFFTPTAVLKSSKQLRHNSSAGPVNLPAEFFKATAIFLYTSTTLSLNHHLYADDTQRFFLSSSRCTL